ncbi:TIGR00369 family protein [Elusimicrobium posterum]|uniref:PaaI family thioesterase n=1 Tax=Elusimicrobium posterum TaxID=3116653 RepID=UPI003C739EBB
MIKQPTSLGCFLCGKDNPIGMKVHWVEDAENKQVVCETTISEDYRSYPGIVHGGIVATLLDETSGRAILMENGHDALMVTLKMEVIYKKVTPTNTPLRIIGRVKRGGTSKALVEGEVVLPDGSVSATCTAIIMRPPQNILSGWKDEEDEWARTSTPKN